MDFDSQLSMGNAQPVSLLQYAPQLEAYVPDASLPIPYGAPRAESLASHFLVPPNLYTSPDVGVPITAQPGSLDAVGHDAPYAYFLALPPPLELYAEQGLVTGTEAFGDAENTGLRFEDVVQDPYAEEYVCSPPNDVDS